MKDAKYCSSCEGSVQWAFRKIISKLSGMKSGEIKHCCSTLWVLVMS